MHNRPTIRCVSPIAAFRRSWTSLWAHEDQSERRRRLIIGWAKVIVAAAGGLLLDQWAGAWVAILAALVILALENYQPILRALRGMPQARRNLEDEQIRPYVAEYEREIARRDAEDAARAWQARYGVPLTTFADVSERAGEEVRISLERLREPLDTAAGQAEHLLTFHGSRLVHENVDGRPWGKWVGPQLLAHVAMLKAARELFEAAVKVDADARPAFFTLFVCYRNSDKFLRSVAEIWPGVVSGDMYATLVRRDEALRTSLRDTLAPREFEEVRERIKTTLGDVGF